MAKELTPEEAAILPTELVRCVMQSVERFQTMAANDAKGIIRRRIFTEGKDANGNEIGTYKESTLLSKGRKRKLVKGQRGGVAFGAPSSAGGGIAFTGKVNLFETGILRDSIQVMRDGQGVFLGIAGFKRSDSNITNQELAGIQEDHFGKDIFVLGESESQLVEQAVQEAIEQTIEQCLSQF